MKYPELETAILNLVIAASDESAAAFGAATITRLLREEAVEDAVPDELSEDAWAALATARESILTVDAGELGALIERIDAGILVDDDLDRGIVAALTALMHWNSYLQGGRRGELYELAIRSIEDVDFQVSADLDDMLATPEMAAEYDRIRGLLTS
ncbi:MULTISPECIES: hypothetical protein [unclassified Amycolatopsis]|uniref:hypothetical protein n=1 Tax=unclassified Amycolatopsis TaxID=2618356 RepID=UPI002E11A540|nr:MULTISPECIES: hypothetical protein [unclassified Amycolatopsis]WSJ78572.1 hypothetical protein OG439_06175 [Amycolatopsis sp. NBC_01307]WSK77866.1 hypothetical protein OG570_41930 [Amycolatopsis sp. NBC_01286]